MTEADPRDRPQRIVNLTQHPATHEQTAAGVFDLPSDRRDVLIVLLTFAEIPNAATLRGRACCIAGLVTGVAYGDPEPLAMTAMIGGAPYLMAPLERELLSHGIKVAYAFSLRESIEEVQTDGSVKKTAVFRHLGFVEGATEKRTDVAECQEAQNIIDSEPMVFCPICGGHTRCTGMSADNHNTQGVWHDYEMRTCHNCDVSFCVGRDTRELCRGTVEPRFETPKKNPAVERFFGEQEAI